MSSTKPKRTSKLHLDKYYTPSEIAKHCISKTYEVIGKSNISEIIEPSAGNGSFSNQIDDCIAYDIEPEHESVIQQDFLKLKLPYQEGRLFIGNPPFGSRNNLSLQFFKKSIEIGDYIAFIQPISQFNNTVQMYQFDLIKSYDLGEVVFSDSRKVHCCFNIWKRPENGRLNKPPKKRLQQIEIKEVRKSRSQTLPKDWKYDIGICTWGSVGKEVKYEGEYNQELYLKINTDNKKEIVSKIKQVNWIELYPMTKSPRLKQWQVIKFIQDNFPDVQ